MAFLGTFKQIIASYLENLWSTLAHFLVTIEIVAKICKAASASNFPMGPLFLSKVSLCSLSGFFEKSLSQKIEMSEKVSRYNNNKSSPYSFFEGFVTMAFREIFGWKHACEYSLCVKKVVSEPPFKYHVTVHLFVRL